MKKFSILLLILCLLTGCTAQDPTTAPSTQPSTNQTQKPTERTAPSTVPPTSSTPEATDPTDPEPITFQLYHPDENWVNLITVELTVDALDPDAIIAYLKEYDVLKEDVALNSAELDGTQLNLDLNEAFLTQIYACGTTGEAMLMGSLVNTFFSAYGCERIMVTVNGEIIHSGHADYDTPFISNQ